MRITNQMQAVHITRSLQRNLATQADLVEQGTTGRRLTRASDDPSGAADALGIRARAAAETQYDRNIDNGKGWLAVVDSTLTLVTDVLQRVRDLTLQGASDNTSPAARRALAVEVDQLREELLSLANTTHLGRTVFAGTSDEGVAFRPDYTFTGVPGASVERRVSAGETVRVDADGAAVFGEGATSVFALLDTIAAELRTDTPDSGRVAEIDGALDRVLSAQTAAGTRLNRLERAAEAVRENQVGLAERRMAIEDVDLAELSMDLQLARMAYEASLSIGASVLQTSLLDYLR